MRTAIAGTFINVNAIAHISGGVTLMIGDGIVTHFKAIDNDVITLIQPDHGAVIDQWIGKEPGAVFNDGSSALTIRHERYGRPFPPTTVNR
jgi:hypothetical protein